MGEFVHVYNDGGGIRNVNVPRSPLSISGMPKNNLVGDSQAIEFDQMVPKILSSYNTSCTAVQALNVVTVTVPTAHNIPATIYDGYYVYFPGSPNILAGWYPGFSRTGTTTFTFTADDSKTVASELVNGGSGLTSQVDFYSAVIPGSTIGKNGRVTARVHRGGDTVSTKLLRTLFGGVVQNSHSVTSSPMGYFGYTFTNTNSEAKQRTSVAQDGTGAAAATTSAVDSSSDQTYVVQCSVNAVQQFVVMSYAELEVHYGA